MTMTDWNNLTNYMDTVGVTPKTFSFNKTQNFVRVTTRGNANVSYTIGSQSGTLTPGQSVSVSELITSFTLTAASGTQTIEVWSTEYGTEKVEDNGISLDDITASLATNTSLDNYSTVVTRDSNGNVTQTQILNGATVVQSTTITRDSNGNVSSIAETLNGKTVTTTINRASDGTVSSTSKVVV